MNALIMDYALQKDVFVIWDGKEKIVLFEISKMGMLEQIFRLNVKMDGQDLLVKKKHASKIVTKMEYAKMENVFVTRVKLENSVM